MGCIIKFFIFLNFLLWIFFDIFCWWAGNVTLGLIGIIGIITFYIAWGLSGEATLAIRDYFRDTEWERFVTQVKWANSATIIVMGILVGLCYVLDWGGIKEFLAP